MDNQTQLNEAKTCPKCRTPKPANEYYTYRRWDGAIRLQSRCKDCKKMYEKLRRRAERAGIVDGRSIKEWRPPWGERSHKAKLNDDDVRLILQLKGVLPARLVAPKFDVKPRTVYAVWQGQYWEHVA